MEEKNIIPRARKVVPLNAFILGAIWPGAGHLYLNDWKMLLAFTAGWFVVGICCRLLLVKTMFPTVWINILFFMPQLISAVAALLKALAVTAKTSSADTVLNN